MEASPESLNIDVRAGNAVEGRSAPGNDEPVDGSYTSLRYLHWNTYLPSQRQGRYRVTAAV